MLKSHMAAIEDHLVASSKIQNNTGHSLHKGTPREIFIKEFLERHLPSNVEIGTGEIIDANSTPGQGRNQFDIIIYNKNYPKLHFGGSIFGYLIESVIATVEVKSTLDYEGLEAAAIAARKSKQLTPHFFTSMMAGYIPPKILNYVVAYDGPRSIATVHGWLRKIYSSKQIPDSPLPISADERFATPSESIDAVFVLNKGFLYFDNTALGWVNAEQRVQNPTMKWVYSDCTTGSILLFFLLLNQATANIQGRWLNPTPYLSTFSASGLKFGP